MPQSKRRKPTPTARAVQLQQAKRRQRERERKAGLVHVQLTVPRATAEKLAVARRSADFEQALEQVLNRNVIRVADYPRLAELMWNRTDALIPAREAFQLYERNWRFVRGEKLDAKERKLIERLADEFGGGLINA